MNTDIFVNPFNDPNAAEMYILYFACTNKLIWNKIRMNIK